MALQGDSPSISIRAHKARVRPLGGAGSAVYPLMVVDPFTAPPRRPPATGLVPRAKDRVPRLRLLLLSLLLTIVLAPAAGWAAAATVRLAPEAVVDRDEIRLPDIATIEGDPALIQRLRAVRLGPAPVAGFTLRIDPDTLVVRLRQHQIDPATVTLVAPDRTLVTRASQMITGEALVEAAMRQAEQRLTRSKDEEPHALVPLSKPADVRVPTGTVDLVAKVADAAPSSTVLSVALTVKVNGREQQTIPMSFRIARLVSVVVAVGGVEPKTPLSMADFRLETRPSTEVPAGALATLSDVSDMEATRSIKAGEVITQRSLKGKVLVRRGESVTLLVEGRGFRITTKGQAVEDARRGDPVRVVNPSSKREIVGKVEAPGLVRVGS